MGVRCKAGLVIFAVPLLGAAHPAAPPPPPPPPPQTTMQKAIHIVRSAVIRLPLMHPHRAPPPETFVEKHAPRCVPAGDVAAAAVVAPDAIDFVLRGGDRLRARLDGDCPSINFYGGFYMSPGEDGRICADRDVIRTRAGGECAIDRFRRLVPATPKP